MEMSDASVEPGLSNRTVSDLLRAAAAPFALALLAGIACYLAGGPTLGLFFGPILFASILAPPLVLAERDLIGRLFVAGAIIDGIAVVWLAAVIFSPTTLLQWLTCYLVLIAWVAALWGVAAALDRLLRLALAAQAVTVILALAWLTWPVWLSPWLIGRDGASIAAWLTPAHPLLAINGVLAHLGIWSEQGIAYHLTNLGQDVPYELPASMLPAVLLHLLVGITMIWLARLRPRHGPHRGPSLA